MYVHLDLGWMHHPFPLSSFRITSPDQIETIRSLGLSRVRWVPEKSVLPMPADPATQEGAGGGTAAEAALADDAPTPDPAADAAAREVAARRRALEAQRAAQARLERQYTEAATALRTASRQARERPERSREDTEALSRALVDKMLGDGELCIRLLSTAAGDRATAHGLNVAIVSLLLGRTFGLEEGEMLDLGVGALLHDLGKLELPSRVHHLDESFSVAEANLYREHVRHGVLIGQRMGLAPGALAVLAQHHEHADGSGFPRRLRGDATAMAARIVALVNRYDNLCNPAVPARALTPHEALSSLFAASRTKYDAAVLNGFIRMMGVYPAGSIVQLTDDRFALVVAVNSSRPLKPRVLVHDPRIPRDDALILDLEQAGGLGIRRSLGASRLPGDALDYLAPRQRIAYFFEPVARPDDEGAA